MIDAALRRCGLTSGDPGQLRMTRLGEESGFASQVVRVELAAGQEPTSVVCKIGEGEAALREAAFYRDVAAVAGVRVPRCYHIEEDISSATACLVLEDLAAARTVDSLADCSTSDAHRVVDGLAGFHGRRWRSASDRLPWAPALAVGHAIDRLPARWPVFLERHGDRVPAAVRAATERVGLSQRRQLERLCEPVTLLHADLHLDNIMFDGDDVIIMDWQRACVGHPAADLAQFIVNSLAVEHRRGVERELLGRYQERLSAAGGDLTGPELDEAYRAATLRWWLGTVNGAGGDDAGAWSGRRLALARAGVERWCAAVDDHQPWGG